MGYARGKVGSVVLARSKGQQVARAHNDKPKNPRTKAQMMQRSIFASAVKFFAQGKQAFFPFAFENKDVKQSDYNAFVSENTARGIHISKMAYDERTYPVLAPWVMTKGVLESPYVKYDAENLCYNVNVEGMPDNPTFGNLCAAIESKYGYEDGDIITIAIVAATGSTASNTPAVEPGKRSNIEWILLQEKLDSTSTAAVTSKFEGLVQAGENSLAINSIQGNNEIEGMCICVSRNTSNGLKVSTSEMVLNTAAETAYGAAQEPGYINEVLASWNASQTPILKGGLSE